MEHPESAPSIPPAAPLSEKKENVTPINPKIAELAESRQELFSRIQNLKQDLQNWRMKLDTQVKVYRNELSELKNSLNTEVDQLRTEFQELRTTLQQQQEDVAASLKNLGLQDDVGEGKEVQGTTDLERSKEIDQDLPQDEGKATRE
ncbi:uveal autoantigen with coiled-coil/ankyrin [Perilla frutescens var. frutescens]|nr:uveal autoantigen with coiled-coil/ankyrin [Perilla frutescens var. frutescens]